MIEGLFDIHSLRAFRSAFVTRKRSAAHRQSATPVTTFATQVSGQTEGSWQACLCIWTYRFYTEAGPPWAPDMLFDDGEPNAEPPDLEISFPPESFREADAPGLEASIREWKVPRAVDRGGYDLESVMLAYLGDSEAPALAIVLR